MGHGLSKDYKIRNKYLKESLKKFDSHELEVLQKIYKELSSKSPTNGIDKETFLQYFNLPGLWGEQLFRIFNISESGTVEMDEFLMGIAMSCRGTRAEKIYVLFKIFDLNNDNYIQKSELIAMLSNFPKMTKYLSKSMDIGDCACIDGDNSFIMMEKDYSILDSSSGLLNGSSKINTTSQPINITSYKSKHYISRKSQNASKPLHEIALSLSKCSFTSALSMDSISKSNTLLLQNNSDFCVPQLTGNSSYCNLNKSSSCRRSVSDQTFDSNTHHLSFRAAHPRYRSAGIKPTFGSMSQIEDRLYDDYSDNSLSYYCDENIEIGISSNISPDVDCYIPRTVKKLSSFNIETSPFDFVYNDTHKYTREDSCPNAILDHKNILHLDDPTFVLVKSIIEENEEQEKLERSNLNLDILVEQIFEECEFNENGMVGKNDSVLRMFSECLHEEVWGLQGNAFFREYLSTDDDSLCSRSNYTYISSSEYIDTSRLNKDNSTNLEASTQLIDVTMRLIYQLFLVNGIHTLGFTSYSHRHNGVVSEELLEHMKILNYSLTSNSDSNGKNASVNGCNSSKFIYEMFACPNCKTTFFMCPRCYSRHTSLSLQISIDLIYIKCSNCFNGGENIFKTCWFCDWEFIDIFKHPEIVKRGLSSCQISNDVTTSNFISDVSLLGTVDMNGCTKSSIGKKTKVPDDLPKHRQSNSCTKAGVMYKIGKTLHQWRSRFYVLNGNILYYYKDKSCARPKGCIFLEGCYLEPSRKRQLGNKYGFSICQKSNKLSKRDFYVENRDQFLDWVDVLSQAMRQQSLTNMYEICEKLGQGKFSIVYRAICKETNEEFAVKIIDKTKIFGQERELLRSEISILKLLKHIHVIYLKEIIDVKDSLYIVMELVRGGELYDLIHSEQRLSEEHTHKIITQLLQTVAYLHKCGIIHRDLKPENLLLTDKTECAAIKLTDFGLSTLCGPNDVLTQPCGTLAYVAPEVLTMQGYNQKADVWSIGVIMYLLIRGRLPFAIKKAMTTNIWDHYKVYFDGPIWRGISSSAKDLIRKLLEPNPLKRISVFEALDHIWVKNFVAVNRDVSTFSDGKNSDDANDLVMSIRSGTDTEATFVIPYSESCNRNIHALEYDLKPCQPQESSSKWSKIDSSSHKLDTVHE